VKENPMGRVLIKPITTSFSATAAMGGLITCLISSANAQLVSQLEDHSLYAAYISSTALYADSTAVSVPGSPVPAFVFSVMPVIVSSTDSWGADGAREPGMFSCTRNGVVSRIGAVGYPQGQAGEFMIYDRFIIPAR